MGRPGSVIKDEIGLTFRELQDVEARISQAKSELIDQEKAFEQAEAAVAGHVEHFNRYKREQDVISISTYADALERLNNHKSQLAQLKDQLLTHRAAMHVVEKHRDSLHLKFKELNDEYDATGAQVIPFHGF